MVNIAVDADEVLQEMKQKQTADTTDSLQKQLDHQEKELDKVMQLLANLYPDYKEGILNKDQYLINKQNYEQMQKDIEKNIEQLKTAVDNASDPSETSNDFIEHFKQHGNIDSLTRPLLTELVDQIVVHENGELEITFNFTDDFTQTDQLAKEKSA